MLSETHAMAEKETLRKHKVLYKDLYHYYEIRYYIIRSSTELSINAGYIEYLKD